MVNEWIQNLSSTEIFLLFLAMCIAFYGLNKWEKNREDADKKGKE